MKRRTEEVSKLQVYIPTALRLEAGTTAEALGQPLTVFVARALAAHILKTQATDQASRSGQGSP
jgi:hypothetical protein